jgi:hypothetical protein
LFNWLYKLYGNYYDWAEISVPFIVVASIIVSLLLAGLFHDSKNNPFGVFCVFLAALGATTLIFPLALTVLFVLLVYGIGYAIQSMLKDREEY